MTPRRVVVDTPATPHFDFLYGRYHLSSWVIPYFSTTMSLRDAATILRLAAYFPGSDDVEWKLDEIHRREVDWPRVERRIVPCLRAAEQPQFFNALTIALLPGGHDLADTRHAFAAQREWRPPTLSKADRFPKTLTVGPITCGYWTDWNDLSEPAARTGQIRWNPDEVFAVALDGQHRLAAIQQFIENPGIPDDRLRTTSLPIIFVTLDPRFGYESPVSRSLVDVLRVIVVDLGKHAKIPTRARQILLDDKDPVSVCVRALVGETVSGSTTDLDARPPRLPLALVDWHSEQARFDEGPYVTTILTLDSAIAYLLGVTPVRNFMDYSALRKQVRALSRWLCVDMTDALRRLDDLEAAELQPFNYSESPENNELERIVTAFRQIWNPVFTSLLTEFAPYRDFIAFRQTRGSFTLKFSNWYRLYHQKKKDPFAGRATTEYRRLLGNLQTGSPPVGEGKLRALLTDIEVRKKKNLAYNVVFQRAYFHALREWIMVEDVDLDDLDIYDSADVFEDEAEDGESGDEQLDGADSSNENHATHGEPAEGTSSDLAGHVRKRAQEFVDCMNVLVDRVPGILQSNCRHEHAVNGEQRFWLGTLLTAEGGIDFTRGASLRARDVIFWVVAMQRYDDRVAPNERSDFDDFWTEVLEPNSGYMRRIRRSVRRYADREVSAGGRILKARGEEFDRERSMEEARARMKWLWTVLEL